MALTPEQHAALWGAKVTSLARDHLGRSGGTAQGFAWGAALESDGGFTALIEIEPLRNLGQALVLAARAGAESLDVIVDEDAADVARRAALFRPSPSVWLYDGATLVAAAARPIEPRPEPVIAAHISSLLAGDGIDIVVEHGQVIGEFRGVEVARVVERPDGQQLDVGVGAYDQDAFAMMHPDLGAAEALEKVVTQVAQHRRRGARPHPLNRLVRERWLRSELLADPEPLGLVSLRPVEAVVPRRGLKGMAPAFALGLDEGDALVLVACAVGIDLGLVPAAVDLAAYHHAERVVLVLPERDQHRMIEALADRATIPVRVVTADEPWA